MLLSLPALGGALIGSMVLRPGLARAGYDWESPATVCQPTKTDGGKVGYTGIALFNESTSASAKVHCPLPYESNALAGDNPIPIPSIEVVYLDRSPSAARVSCTLQVVDFDGNPVFTQTLTSPGRSSTRQGLEFFGLHKSMFAFAEVSITCTLPASTSSSTRSGLRAIRLFSF
jgi:hypothetical protein